MTDADNNQSSKPPQEWPMRFMHKFKCGIVAHATIDEAGQYDVYWPRKVKIKKIELEYLLWRDEIMRAYTEATGRSILVISY
jgi:hypothetical protein